MKRPLLVAVTAFVFTASAQGVLDWLESDYNVIGRGVNGEGTVFIELDSAPRGLEEALKEGVFELESQTIVVITPSLVYYADVSGSGSHTYTRRWVDFIQRNAPGFSTDDIVIEGDGGTYLTYESIEAARQPQLLSPYRASSPRNGCVSTSSATGSSMTCYSNGRVTYRSNCTVNPVTYAIRCTSSY